MLPKKKEKNNEIKSFANISAFTVSTFFTFINLEKAFDI